MSVSPGHVATKVSLGGRLQDVPGQYIRQRVRNIIIPFPPRHSFYSLPVLTSITHHSCLSRVWAAHSAVQAERRSGGAGAGDIAEGLPGLDAAMISAIARRAAVDDPTATRILSGSDSHAEIFPDGANFDTGDAWEIIASGSHVASGSAGSTDPEDDGERAWGEEEGAEDAELLRVLDVPELRSTVEDVLNRLPSVQGEVIAYKYGLRGDGPLMRKEIAERLGFKSASLVQYHHTKAMKSFANVLQYMHKFEK